MNLRLLFILLFAFPAQAETVVPSRTIRAFAIISEADVTVVADTNANSYSSLNDVIGQEARVVLYPGRPILLADIGPPAIVTRNQLIRIKFLGTGLTIITEGRALERGAVGDMVRVMNLSSRTTLFGKVQDDGTIQVKQ